MTAGVVLVTGGNSGIGFECARELARRGSRVLIASRNQEASEDAVRCIARQSGDGSVSAMPLDLGSFASVRHFAKEIEARDLPLSVNAYEPGLVPGSGLARVVLDPALERSSSRRQPGAVPRVVDELSASRGGTLRVRPVRAQE